MTRCSRRANRRLSVWGAVLVAAWIGAASSRGVETTDNAAFYYWKAAALIPGPQTQDEWAAADFVDTKLPRLSPEALRLRPEAVRWLTTGQAMRTALATGAGKKTCDFSVITADRTGLDLSHLPVMRALTTRALAMAKAYEFLENPEGAASLYVDLLSLIQHLDQDQNVSSGLAALELFSVWADQLQDFVARAPSATALTILTHALHTTPSRWLQPAAYLRQEQERLSCWLLSEPGGEEKRLARLYGENSFRPAVDRLKVLKDEPRAEKFSAWVKDYQTHMGQLAEAMEKPYAEGLPLLRALDEEREKILEDKYPAGCNPLLPLLLPPATMLYERFLLAQGLTAVSEIICTAGLYRAAKDRWPVNLEELARFSSRTIPRDPFSAQPFYYRLSRGLPEIIIRVPKRLLSSTPPPLHAFALGERLRTERAALEALVAEERQRLNSAERLVPVK